MNNEVNIHAQHIHVIYLCLMNQNQWDDVINRIECNYHTHTHTHTHKQTHTETQTQGHKNKHAYKQTQYLTL